MSITFPGVWTNSTNPFSFFRSHRPYSIRPPLVILSSNLPPHIHYCIHLVGLGYPERHDIIPVTENKTRFVFGGLPICICSLQDWIKTYLVRPTNPPLSHVLSSYPCLSTSPRTIPVGPFCPTCECPHSHSLSFQLPLPQRPHPPLFVSLRPYVRLPSWLC